MYISLVYSESSTPSGLACEEIKGWKKMEKISAGRKSYSKKRLKRKGEKAAESWRKAYLILLQPTELCDQTGERIFSWDSRPIWNEGIFGHQTEGGEACDCYREPTECDVRRQWCRVWTPHTEDIFVLVVLKRYFGLCSEL